MAQRIKLMFEAASGQRYTCLVTPTEEHLSSHDNDINLYLDFLIESCWRETDGVYILPGVGGIFSVNMSVIECVVGMIEEYIPVS
jgi:hypothetical protein